MQKQGAECGKCRECGKCSLWFRRVSYFSILGYVREDSGECYQIFWRTFMKILGNGWKDSGELIKSTLYLKKANAEAWSVFAMSNETIERSNNMIRYFHFFWNSNWKEIARPWEKRKKEKLKTNTNRRRKWIKEIKVFLYSCWKEVTVTHHNCFKIW